MLYEYFSFLESKAILDYKTLKLRIRKRKREKNWNLLYFNTRYRERFNDVYVFLIFDLENDDLI